MNRIIFLLCSLCICLHSLAQSVTIDGITYKANKDGAAYVYSANKGLVRAEIKSSVDIEGKTYTVNEIFRDAFTNCNKSLNYVSIPNSIKKIRGYAFLNCKVLYDLVVPDNPIDIRVKRGAIHGWLEGPSAFLGAVSVTSVRCQNGSYPTYMLSVLPDECPFLKAPKHQQQVQPQVVYIEKSNPKNDAEKAAPKKMSSDVDIDIPTVEGKNENTFVVIIANENYQEEEKVEYALNDGEMFKTYCHKILSIPEKNIHIRKDATLNNMNSEMTWLQNIGKAFDGEARFIIYYAGHGIPDEKSATAYLLPVDGKGSMTGTAYSLEKFYNELGNIPSVGVTIFLDACFSGSKRGDGMLASARGVAIKAKPQEPKGKMAIFTAAQGDETAYPYKEKEHGLFTYYLLKKLQETKGDATFEELAAYIKKMVSRESIVSNGKPQTPSINVSSSIENEWKGLKLK